MENANTCIHSLRPQPGSEEPTVGAIKRALHDLSRTPWSSAQEDAGENLREAHALLRQLARRNGINPDDAVQRRRAAVQSQRDHLVRASATASEKSSS